MTHELQMNQLNKTVVRMYLCKYGGGNLSLIFCIQTTTLYRSWIRSNELQFCLAERIPLDQAARALPLIFKALMLVSN
jgi:hypothetical protein